MSKEGLRAWGLAQTIWLCSQAVVDRWACTLSLVVLNFKMRSWRHLEVERGTSHAVGSLLMSIRIRLDYQKKMRPLILFFLLLLLLLYLLLLVISSPAGAVLLSSAKTSPNSVLLHARSFGLHRCGGSARWCMRVCPRADC